MRDKLFGTNGIRGEADSFFTPKFCQAIGATFSAFLKSKGKNPSDQSAENTIAVAMDPRPSSQSIKDNLIKGLGPEWQITDQGIVPTPCLTYFVKQQNLAGGVMITGSHIEEQLNGLKFFFAGEEITKDDEREIEKLFFSQFNNQTIKADSLPKISQSDQARKLYQTMLLRLASSDLSRFKVIVDAGNGTQSQIMPEVLTKLGLKVIKINCNLGQKMLTRDTEKQGSFTKLLEAVKTNQVDLGLTYDSDGDRVAFITDKGEFLPGEVSASLIALSEPGDSIIVPINASSVVESLGKKVIRTKVGATYVAQVMKERQINFGFEANGGTISAEFHYGRDGGITTMKLLNLLNHQNQSLSQLAGSLPRFFIIKDKIDCPSALNNVILKKARERYQQQRIEELDGLKIWFNKEDWLLFRPSGNAPEFRVFAESRNQQEAQKLVSEGLDLVKEVINEHN